MTRYMIIAVLALTPAFAMAHTGPDLTTEQLQGQSLVDMALDAPRLLVEAETAKIQAGPAKN